MKQHWWPLLSPTSGTHWTKVHYPVGNNRPTLRLSAPRNAMEHKIRARREISIGMLAVFVFAVSILAADTSLTARLRHYGTYLQSGVRSTPDGDPANRWSAPGAPLLDTFSGPEANHALSVFRLSCASVAQPHAPSVQCETLLRHSR